MNKFFWVIGVASLSTFLAACSKDSSEQDLAPLNGVWQLTAWNVNESMDMDKDGVAHTNILDEISCPNNETLEFDANGVVTFNNAFNPNIKITALNNVVANLDIKIVCDNGSIGSASTYVLKGNTITMGSTIAVLNGNEIDILRKGKFKILGSDMATVLFTMDVMEVYTKM